MADRTSAAAAALDTDGTVVDHEHRIETSTADAVGAGIARVLGTSLAARATRALLVGCAAIGIAGCGSSSSSSSTTQASAPAATPTTASTAATTSTGTTSSTASSAPGTTGPGTALALGQTATVPYQPDSGGPTNKPTYRLEVTVTAIEPGSFSDFNGIKLDAAEKAGTPFYVKAKFTNVGSGDAGREGGLSVNVQGVDKTGETQSSVTFFGSFPRCEDKEPPKPFTHGKSFETCLVFLVPGGITKAAYTNGEAYITSPVTWK